MANTEEREESKRRELARKGCIMEASTQEAFVRVYPAFGIEKVKFAFVDIGTHGKGFDIYVDMDEFDLLCDDILSKDLKRAILAESKTEKNQYPCSWKYVTGNKGEKEIRISKGLKGEVNIYAKVGNKRKNIPVAYNDLRIMAKYFRRVSEKHFNMLTNLTLQGMEQNAKFFKPDAADKSGTEKDTESTNTKTNSLDNSVKAGNDTQDENANVVVALTTESALCRVKDNMYRLDVTNMASNEMTKLYFNEESICSLGEKEWLELQENVKKKKIVLNICAQENKGAYLFKSMAA